MLEEGAGFKSMLEALASTAALERLRVKDTDGPNGILVWVEGVSHPVGRDVSEDVRLEDVVREKLTLQLHFVIYSHDCSQHSPIEADCHAPEGVWTKGTIRRFRKVR